MIINPLINILFFSIKHLLSFLRRQIKNPSIPLEMKIAIIGDMKNTITKKSIKAKGVRVLSKLILVL